ncbi:alpha/beta hydrolase [Limnohabitans sp. Rim8]|uniref:alpha/beta fold hydrolase n=1 Tax=Limnohabitans sp. Rim8 TaxID=1100718 RepID=UPI002636E25F|nr:alpha/beta hydrolase [Limnohabitans sp. Rim8]
MLLPVSEKTDVFGIQLETQFIPAPAGQEHPVLVFLHEGLGSVHMWRDWPRLLCQQLGCAGWVYSRQGYGLSDAVADVRGPAKQSPEGHIRSGRLQPDYMHREAQVVLPELLDRWGIQRPVLIGHSDGGTIALLHAAHSDVHACIAMAPHVMVEDMSIQAIQLAREAFEKGSLRERLKTFHADVDCAFWQWNDVWLSEGFRSFDMRDTLTKIRAPVLAIQGVDDPYGSMAHIEDIARLAPQTQLLQLTRCGHSPHRDQPLAVNQTIEAFLKNLRA